MYIHLRGPRPAPLLSPAHRSLDVHGAVQRADVHVLGGAEPAVRRRRALSGAARRCRDNWQMMRDEALQLFDEGHIRAAAKYNDLGFNSFFKTRLEALLRQVVRRAAAFGEGAVPEDRRAGRSRFPSVNARDVRAAAARRRPGQASRSVRRIAALSPRARHAELDDLPASASTASRTRWRDGEAVMFDETFIHWAENKTGRDAAHPVLRRRAAADEPHHGRRSTTGSKPP